MMKEFVSRNGTRAKIQIPEPRDMHSVFVVAGHKTGSVLLTNIINDIKVATQCPAIAVEGDVWQHGFAIKDWPDELYAFLSQPGFIFYSFRWLQKLPELPNFAESKKIFLVRDPRDVAVSYFYSMKKSHVIPKKGSSREQIAKLREFANQTDINEFVISGKAGPILRNIQKFT